MAIQHILFSILSFFRLGQRDVVLLAYTHSITIRIRQCEIPSAYFSFFFVFVQTIYRSEVTGCSKEVINGYISFPHPSLGFFFVRFVALAPIGDQIPQCGTWLDRDVENKSNLTCTMKILNSSKSMGKVQKGDEGGITYIARKEREATLTMLRVRCSDRQWNEVVKVIPGHIRQHKNFH